MNVENGKIDLVKVKMSDELVALLNSSDQSLPELTKVSNNAAWYVNKPKLKSD